MRHQPKTFDFLFNRLLGKLLEQLSHLTAAVAPEMETPAEMLTKLLLFHLNSRSAIQRSCIGMILTEWAKLQTVS